MEINKIYHYDKVCYLLGKVSGIRFAGIINKQGRKIAGGFSPKAVPLEADAKRIEMLMMEITLDLSMRKEFDNSLGKINALISYRDKVNIITIPIEENLMLLSSEPQLDPLKVIQIARNQLEPEKILEVTAN